MDQTAIAIAIIVCSTIVLLAIVLFAGLWLLRRSGRY